METVGGRVRRRWLPRVRYGTDPSCEASARSVRGSVRSSSSRRPWFHQPFDLLGRVVAGNTDLSDHSAVFESIRGSSHTRCARPAWSATEISTRYSLRSVHGLLVPLTMSSTSCLSQTVRQPTSVHSGPLAPISYKQHINYVGGLKMI